MGKFDTDQDLARSKYIIIASVAAIGMVLGAMSVGAVYKKQNPNTKYPVLSQVYPIPANDSGDDSSKGNSTPQKITPSFSKEQSLPLAAHQDWGKKALLTDPVNLQVRVGLTQAGVQVNALGLSVAVPPVSDVLQGVTGILDGNSGDTSSSTPTDTGSTSTGDNTGSNTDQPPASTDEQMPPSSEQAATLGANSELIVTP